MVRLFFIFHSYDQPTDAMLHVAFDQQGFNSTQAMDAFDRDFGVCDAKGVCALEPYYLSLLNGLIYIGFAAGQYF